MRNIRELDELDRAILVHLRRDGRITNVELARRVGLTPPPCLRRVRRLEDDGIISGYRAVVDPAAAGLGFEVMVSVWITVTDAPTLERFEAAVVAFEEVVEFRRLFGSPDYLLRVLVRDGEAYEQWQSRQLIGLPGIRRVVSHLTQKRIKTLD